MNNESHGPNLKETRGMAVLVMILGGSGSALQENVTGNNAFGFSTRVLYPERRYRDTE